MTQNPGTLDATGDVATESKQDEIIDKQPTSLGDGSVIDKQDSDGTVGTTKGTLMMGIGVGDVARPIDITGVNQNELRVQDLNTHLLAELLLELKAIKSHLAALTEVEFDGTE